MVSVTIVTWNSVKYLEESFASILRQDYPELEVIIVDNASDDGTRALLHEFEPRWRVIYKEKNLGFAAGQNQAIRASRGEWVLCLNPDVVLSPDFITQLARAGAAHPDANSLCGKLLRWDPFGHNNSYLSESADQDSAGSIAENGSYQGTTSVVPTGVREDFGASAPAGAQGLKPRSWAMLSARLKPCPDTNPLSETADPRKTNIIDSTGIYFTRNMRHLDRGAEERDGGQYDRVQYVFGASGAAAMFRRDFIEAVSVQGEFFDEEFFAFREDGDLAWRAQLMGWKCLYMPAAVAWHVRRVTPERRRDLPLVINWHSAKNRFLMRGKNASGWLCWRLFFPVLWRDLLTCGYALLRDWRMLSALAYPLRNMGSIRRKRAIIQSRRKISDRDLLWWFCNTPRAVAIEEKQTAAREAADSTSTKAV
jgi:GT2 family glycosyltransferase